MGPRRWPKWPKRRVGPVCDRGETNIEQAEARINISRNKADCIWCRVLHPPDNKIFFCR